MYGASFALALASVALIVLIVLLYTTVNQTRPVQIIKSIHDLSLSARDRQRDLLQHTRRAPSVEGSVRCAVRAGRDGYLVGLKTEVLRAAALFCEAAVEVTLCGAIGATVAFHDVLAEIVGQNEEDAARMAAAVCKGVQIELSRDVDTDPAYGVEQLLMIAWTSASTAKQNPTPGLLVTRALGDLLARWSEPNNAPDKPAPEPAPVVYHDDVLATLFDAFESLTVVASESLQHQVAAEVYQAMAGLYDRLTLEGQQQIEQVALRSLATLGEHAPTRQLDRALEMLVNAFVTAGRFDGASAVRRAQEALNHSVGRLNSRATRVPKS